MAGYYAKPPKGAVLNRADPSAGSLVAAWLFNEKAGLAAYDAVGRRQNKGTLNGSPTWTSGLHGAALSLAGSPDRVAMPGKISSVTTDWTIVALINPSSLPQTAGCIFSNGDDTSGYGIFIGDNGNSGSKLNGLNPGTSWIDSTYTFPAANQWYCVVVTHTGGNWRFYVREEGGTFTASTVSGATKSPTDKCEIGHHPDQAARYFAGKIGVVLFCERPLPDVQARAVIADPFRMFRRRRAPVPLSPPSGANTANVWLLSA